MNTIIAVAWKGNCYGPRLIEGARVNIDQEQSTNRIVDETGKDQWKELKSEKRFCYGFSLRSLCLFSEIKAKCHRQKSTKAQVHGNENVDQVLAAKITAQ